ncbi:lipase family protein [uncultured Salinisphaera sp.]|uniref:lipase family protein n=1 Tax=uncultured Salinisphaera sp. TaxID=359372 RepID=UPI0032B2B221|tara:strand:+ start:5497 stop:6807 length:1311 start_codon:yes stop_codon:yes gene_type:complete
MDIGRLNRCLAGLFVVALTACVQGPFDAASTPPPGLVSPGRPAHDTPIWQPVAWPAPGDDIAIPDNDPFYRSPASVRLAALAPGTVVRYRPIVARSYKLGYVQAHAWQFVYISRDTHGAPIADTASLLIPAPARGRLLSYQVAYDALNPVCNPSQELLRGTMLEQRFVSAALRRGWSVVLPDHEGPDMAYLSGRQAGHAVLDGLRGAHRLTGRPDDPIGLWGYSGGGFATLWAAQMAVDYAPGLPIKGVAAGGVPGDLDRVAEHLDGHAFAGLYFQAFFGLANAYPEIDLERLLNDKGRAVEQRLSTSCLGQWLSGVRDPLLSGLGFASFADYTTVDAPREQPDIQAILSANRLGEQRLVAPLYYYHGALDPIVGRDQARALLARYCDLHSPLVYDWALGEHILAALTQADDALDFLDARAAGRVLHGPGCEALEG